jgi:DNA invertase Pin-like site-specific DNA recombinase
VIVFDEVARMSRNAEDGFKLYEELYNKGVELIFLKESTLNTENFRQTQQIASVGNEIADMYIDTTNKVLMILAKQQIKKAFETAQAEVDFLHQRTSEGVRRAQAEGKRVGRANGVKVTTKKSISMKADIKKLSRDFDGKNTDAEVIKLLGIARNTYYKYKKEMLAD